MRTSGFVLALALLAAPAPALYAQTQAPADQQRVGPRGPAAAVLQQRAELGLTAEQITRLEAIQADFQQRNQPLMEQMQAMRGERPGQRRSSPPTDAEREAFRQQRDQMRPLMDQMRENNRAALEQVNSVLTEQQREKARVQVRERRGMNGEAGMRGQGMKRGDGSGQGMRGQRGQGMRGGPGGMQMNRTR